MEFFFLLLWIACGVAAAIIASNKGRNGCGWFAVGFFLGPIGLVLALMVGKNETAVVARGEMKRCPDCAELVRVAAVKCRYCGTVFRKRT